MPINCDVGIIITATKIYSLGLRDKNVLGEKLFEEVLTKYKADWSARFGMLEKSICEVIQHEINN